MYCSLLMLADDLNLDDQLYFFLVSSRDHCTCVLLFTVHNDNDNDFSYVASLVLFNQEKRQDATKLVVSDLMTFLT